MSKFEVFPEEEAAKWSPFTDAGYQGLHAQPSRIRAVALHLSSLCAISSDLIKYFYHPFSSGKAPAMQTDIKRLSEIHMRLEEWRKQLPAELTAKEGALPSVLVMQ